MANKITCTCGHSWNKSDSSKKDMNVCHICGKDNTMKDGGWLDKYEQGGLVLKQKTHDNYGKKPNANYPEVTLPPGFVGQGYNIKGRNYSPAWGGQFQNGGELTENNWLDKYQDGGESPQVNEKEKILKHSPNSKGHYELTKTITPFKTNRQIRKGVEAPLYPNEVNFISNYTGSLGDIKNQPSAVEFEGDKHWNIDRFIMDPAFGHGYPALESGQSKKGLKKNVLADMYKYYMLQGQDKDDAFRNAKQFMRQEINPRLNSKYFKEASRLTGVHNEPITNFADENPFKRLRDINNQAESLRSNPFYKEYFENPLTEREMKQISKSYLKNFKKMSGKESRKKVKEWIKETNAPEVHFQPSGISMGQEDYRDGGNLMPPMAGADQTVPMYAMGGSLPGAVGFTYARVSGAAPANGPYAKKTKASAQNGQEMKFYQAGLDFTPKTISRNGGWLDKFDDEVPQAQTGFLTQRYSTGPMMGDLATQSGVPTQGEVARQDQLRKEVEAAKQKKAARARYEAMPKIGPAKQRNYSEQVQADERRRRLNKEYIADKPHLRLDSKGDIINTNPELTLEGQSIPYTSAAKAEKFARSWETPLAIEGALSLAPLVGRGAVAAGEYLTTQTPVRNAYKLNPWAFKPKSTLNYRQVGQEGFEDLERTGLVRGAGENITTDPNKNLQQVLDYYSAIEKGTPNMSGAMNIKAPYFQRGNLFYDVNSPEAKYLIETTQGGTGVFSPAQSGFVFKGEGFYPSNAPGGIGVLNPSVFDRELANFNIYKRDWLRGYKPVKKENGGDVPVDPMGYWNPDNWGNPVIIPSTDITMEGVDVPLIGISDTGDVQYMEPGEDYQFEGEYVTEYPVAKKGISVNNADAQPLKKLDQLLNFTNYNKPTKGGWLDKYN